MHVPHPRPMGPRSIARSASPAPPLVSAEPLQIRRSREPTTSPSPPASLPKPSISLSIPAPPNTAVQPSEPAPLKPPLSISRTSIGVDEIISAPAPPPSRPSIGISIPRLQSTTVVKDDIISAPAPPPSRPSIGLFIPRIPSKSLVVNDMTSAPAPPPLRPHIGLSIPGIPSHRANTPKGIKLSIPISNGPSDGQLDDGSISSYYGTTRPLITTTSKTESPEDLTIMPATREAATLIPPPKPTDLLEDLHRTMSDIHLAAPTALETSNTVKDEEPLPQRVWSDDDLEELAPLGEGAGGAVHKVRDKRTGTIMARKTITIREAPMRQLIRELSIISSMAHPNIILFYNAYVSPSSSEVKILMENCEGGSLEGVGKRIKEHGAIVGEKIAGRLAEGVLQGLAYLHSRKTIHRDIKPSNILLSREGVVKLCDFGVSGELVKSEAGTFTGTSFYMAPERITGNQYTIRSDVWSTGISLLELVQNRFPFPSDLGPIELIMYISQSEPPSLDDEPGVRWTDAMKDFIKQTLQVDPSRRPIPKDMLSHPWVVEVMKQDVNMARWIREVWGWRRPTRRSRDHTADSRPPSNGGGSRPSSSHRNHFGVDTSPDSSPQNTL